MSKRKDRHGTELFTSLEATSVISEDALCASTDLVWLLAQEGKCELVRMKKFRFQLLHEWIVQHIVRCRVADIGGGKGLMAYLLGQSGWTTTVIDPVYQALPTKYKDLLSGKQIHIDASASVLRLNRAFAPEMARDYGLLIALHAHGCNIIMIDAAAKNHCQVILLPCCIIDEPLIPAVGEHWLQCIVEYAKSRGFTVEPFRLNFKGQNIGLYLTPA